MQEGAGPLLQNSPSVLNPRVRAGIWRARRTMRALPACGPRLRTLRVRALRSSPAPSPRPSITPAARPLLTDPGLMRRRPVTAPSTRAAAGTLVLAAVAFDGGLPSPAA